MAKRKAWTEYPVRTSRWGEECAVCGGKIQMGERYRDGGYSRRVHLRCASPHPTTDETRPEVPGAGRE